MPNIETTASDTLTTGGGKADWSAVQEDFSDVIIKTEEKPVETPVETKPEEIKIEESAKLETKAEETKPEPTAEEKAKEVETLKAEAKELGLPETATKEDVAAAKLVAEPKSLEFKLDDIQNVPQEYEDGTFKALAKNLYNVDLADETPEAFQKAFVPREEFEKVQNITLDSLLSTLNPEVATDIKLMQMGWSREQVLAPTREIEQYLSLDDAALIRADLEAQGDLTPEIIDNKMENLAAEPQKMKLAADEMRILLNREKNQIIENRKQTLQKYESDKQAAILHQQKQERNQVTDALNNVSTFMGVPVTKEVKEAFVKKYNNGLYDTELNSPAGKAQFIFQREMGEKLTKHIQNKASEAAKMEVTKKLLNVPPVQTGAGQRVDTSKQPTDNPWGAVSEDFKS